MIKSHAKCPYKINWENACVQGSFSAISSGTKMLGILIFIHFTLSPIMNLVSFSKEIVQCTKVVMKGLVTVI